MTTKAELKPRKVKLQINAAGSWRDVLRFCIDEVETDAVQVAAANLVTLADPAGRTSLRIATDDCFQTALFRWDAKKGWVEV